MKDKAVFAPAPLMGFFRRCGGIKPNQKFIYIVRIHQRKLVKIFGKWMLN